jgi:hypothetical protein
MGKKYGMKEYAKDEDIFAKESINKGEQLSKEAHEAQSRLNKVPELGKKYYKKNPERLNAAENYYKERYKEHR